MANLQAQELQFGLDVQIGAPQNEYKTQLGNRLGVGVDGMVELQLHPSCQIE